jgi:hypothetical protein
VRNPAINLLLSAIGLVAFVSSGKLAAVEPIYDVVVYGGFSAVFNEKLDRECRVKMEGKRIVSITMLSGKTYAGKMFIDATYVGG